MNSYFNYFLLFLLSVSGFCYSQKEKLEEANEKFKQFAFVDARSIYLEVANDGYRSADLLKKLGDSYYFNNELENAMEWYAELITKYDSSDYEDEYLFRYSQTLKALDLHKNANNILKAYYTRKGVDEDANYSDDKEINYLKNNPNKITLIPFKYNSSFSDFAPQYGPNNSLIFSSSRDSLSNNLHAWNNQPYLDLYKVDNNTVTKFSNKVNTIFHETTAIFTKNKDTLYFTRNNYSKKRKRANKNGTMLIKMYRATSKNGGYLNHIIELPFNSNNYSVAHPALSTNGNELYFTSDMPGSIGESDIFKVKILSNGKFGEPINLGPKINTINKETFPFIDSNGNLYFASDGHKGLGGLDIYVSKKNIETFHKPVNLGFPINTESDDFTLIINNKTNIGYFASNRPGGKGDDDIYKFKKTATKDLYIQCTKVIKGEIKDYTTKKNLSGSTIVVLDKEYNELFTTKSNNIGEYVFKLGCFDEYILRILKDNYATEEVLMRLDDEDKLIKPISLRKGHQLKRVLLNIGDDLNNTLELSPIYFDTNKSIIKNQSKIELQKLIKLLQRYPDLKLSINSHTDQIGTKEYNQRLSLERSKSTKSYIINQGNIDSNRISLKNYGESKPIINCEENCSEYENKINRRCEFVVLN